MTIELIDKATPVLEPVVKNLLFFLIKFYLKSVLDYTSKIGYCKVDFCNIGGELCWVGMEVEVTLE